MAIFFLESIIGDVFESIFRNIILETLSYGESSFACESSMSRREALDRLGEEVDTQSTLWPWSKEKFFVGTVADDAVKLGCGRVWGPVLYGTVEGKSDGGSILRGTFRLGSGATSIFGLIVAGLVVTVAMTFFGPWHPGAIGIWLLLSVLTILVGGLRISKHKGGLLPEIRSRLRDTLCQSEGLVAPGE